MPSKMHVCKERVVKDGKLAAFEGQLVTMEEAVSLGLTKADGEKPEKGPTVAELKEQAKSLDIVVPAKVTASALKKLIAEALEYTTANAPDTAGTAEDSGADAGGDADGDAVQNSEDGDGE